MEVERVSTLEYRIGNLLLRFKLEGKKIEIKVYDDERVVLSLSDFYKKNETVMELLRSDIMRELYRVMKALLYSSTNKECRFLFHKLSNLVFEDLRKVEEQERESRKEDMLLFMTDPIELVLDILRKETIPRRG